MVPFRVEKGFFRLCFGVFGSQTSRTSRGTKKRPIRGRVWRRLGLYIYTQQREQRGATSGQKRGGFRLPNKQDVPGKGAKQEGGLSELPMRPYPGAAYGMAQMISSKYPGYLIFGTTYLAPHTWHKRHHRAHIYTDRPNLNPNPNLCIPQSYDYFRS